MSPSNDRRRAVAALSRTIGAAVATAGLLFASATSVAAAGAAGPAGHSQSNVPVDQSGCGLIPLDVELIVDRSGSMGANSSNGHTRLYWAQHAADQLVDSLDANGGVGAGQNHHVGVTSFHNTTANVDLSLDGASASTAKAAIDSLTSSGNTPLAQGMAAGAADMSSNGRDTDFGLTVQHVIIILSDGRPWPDSAPARPSAGQISSFRGSADSIYSIAIGQGGTSGTANEVDLALMASLAKPASGYFNVTSASDLPSLFADIFTNIACRPGIQVDKTADPTELPAGGGTVDYSYVVTNVGNVALSNVVVSDDKCSPVTFVDGDADHDGKLDLTETWTFTCSADLTATTTNVATATGWRGETKVEDGDDATVTVAEPTPTPTATATASPSTAPTDSPTTSPTDSPTTSPTDSPTTSPTDSPSTSPTDSPSTSPSHEPTGSVSGETGTPAVTPPSTSTLDETGGTSGTSPLLLALAMVALVLGVLYATPRPTRRTVENPRG
jgi:uncharacterized repeat protein (TIGR01451 family)